MSKESFLKDRRTQQAMVLNLMVIGEAAARIYNVAEESNTVSSANARRDLGWEPAFRMAD